MSVQKTAIIIGAGLAGLSAGCFAQQQGIRSVIYEHNHISGGVVICWERQGFLIDGGVHLVPLPDPKNSLHPLYSTVGIDNPDLYVPMKELGKYVDEPSGKTVVLTDNLNLFSDYVKKNSPEDAKFVDQVIADSRSLTETDLSTVGMDTPPELNSMFAKIGMMWHLRHVYKYFGKQYCVAISDYAKSLKADWLRRLFDYIFTPTVPTWFILNMLGDMERGHWGYLKRGSRSFVEAIEKKYRSLGGDIKFSSTVAKILVKDGKACGIKLADGQEHFADYIIAAGDGYNTLFNLLDGKYISPKIAARYKTQPITKPFMFVSFGLKRDFAKESPYTNLVLKEPLLSPDGKKLRQIFFRTQNYGEGFAPAGKSVLQVEMEGDWTYWENLRKANREEYMARKKQLSDSVLVILERYYPGITAQVEMTDVATPATTNRFTMNHQGAWGGFDMTAENVMDEHERILPGLKNFYMAGQWAVSGGVIPCLFSGKNVVDIIMKGY